LLVQDFLEAGCPSRQPTNRIKALKFINLLGTIYWLLPNVAQ